MAESGCNGTTETWGTHPAGDPSQPPPAGLIGWYLLGWRKYAGFDGRARRREYWTFTLGNTAISCVLGFALGFAVALGGWNPALARGVIDLFALATIVPNIAVGIRRMHDTDRRGWWILLPIVNLVFFLLPSQAGGNRFGPEPPRTAAAPGAGS